MTIGIGSKVWIFDANRRRYKPKKPGEIYSSGPPIWIEHWREMVIVGETPRSWVLQHGEKVPKRGANPATVMFNYDDVKRAAWVHENVYAIADKVRQTGLREGGNAEPVLRQIAALIDYKEKA